MGGRRQRQPSGWRLNPRLVPRRHQRPDAAGGHQCSISPIAWHSQKIDRTCRSPGAAEAQAAVNGEDCLYYGRYEWSELLHGGGDLHDPDALVRLTGGCVVTDSRNVYDRLSTEVIVIKGAEKAHKYRTPRDQGVPNQYRCGVEMGPQRSPAGKQPYQGRRTSGARASSTR